MSLVLFYPYAASFSSSSSTANEAATTTTTDAIPSLANGTAVANFGLAILAMIQNPSNPRFSLSVYFCMVLVLFTIAIGGYIGTIVLLRRRRQALNHKHYYEATLLLQDEEDEDNELFCKTESSINCNDENGVNSGEMNPLLKKQGFTSYSNAHTNERMEKSSNSDSNGNKREQNKVIILLQHYICKVVNGDSRFYIPHLVQFLWNTFLFFLPGVVPYAVKNVDQPKLALFYLTTTQLVSHTIGTALTSILSYDSKKHQKHEDCQLAVGWILAITILWIPLVRFCIHPTSNFYISIIPIVLNATLCGLYSYTSTRCFQIVSARCVISDNNSDCHIVNRQSVTRMMGVLHQLGAMMGSILGFWVVSMIKHK